MNKTSAAIVRTLLLGTSCLSALALSLSAVKADPSGGVVVSGSAVIGGTANNTVINQSTNRALINWQNFSVAAGGSVRFNQPNGSSITVNRVVGSEASSINGSMFANGNVWLLNGNGILFGKGSSINVGGLLATTSDINTRDFENGSFNFTGGTGASVVNQGTIRTTAGGTVVLSGSSVSNQGLISAQTGTVVLGGASAFTVDFVGDGLIKYAITAPAQRADNGQTGVSNTGTINANNGGRVLMTARAAAAIADAVVNNKGLISATSATVRDGIVILDAGGGTANVSGSIDVSGARGGQTGGTVAITGITVNVADSTRINASGDAGGGTVLIGGDAHGQGDLATADNVTVGAATVSADAVRSGDGGKLVVWSNGITDFSGIFSAMGGAKGGNGGFVETSGHDLNISHTARVTTLAPKGHTGNWLIDPTDINIVEGGADGIGGANIDPDDIIAALAGTNVTLEADNDITVTDALNYASANTLSLLAQHDIITNADIQNADTGAVYLIAGWDGLETDPENFLNPDVFGNNSGTVTIGQTGSSAVGSASGTTTVAGYDLVLQAVQSDSYHQIGYRGAGGGNITVAAVDALSLYASGNADSVAQIGNGDKLGNVAGNITGNIAITVGGATSFQLAGDGTIWIGNSATGAGTATGDLTVTTGTVIDASSLPFAAPLLPMLAQNTANGDVLLDVTGEDLSIASALSYDGDHSLTLQTLGTLNVNAAITNTGSGSLTLGGYYMTANPSGSISASAVRLNSDTGINLNNSGNNIVAGTLDIHSGDTVALSGSDNAVSNLTFDLTAGQFNFSNTLDLTLGTSTAPGAVSLGSDGPIIIDGHVTAGSFSIVAGGELSETENGYLESGGTAFFAVNASAGGVGIQLTNPLNAISGEITAYTWVGDTAYYSNSAVALAAMSFVSGDVTVLSADDITVNGNIQLSGDHDLALIAGWDGTETDPAHFLDAGVFGNSGGTITIGDAAVGSAGGTTTLAAYDIALQATANGVHSQIGFRGAGGGDIKVAALNTLTLNATTGNAGTLSQIGNGDKLGSVSGAVSGNISINVGDEDSGQLALQRDNSGGTIWIGNSSTGGGTGTLTITAFSARDINGNTSIVPILAADTAYGDVFYGIYGTGSDTAINLDSGKNVTYNSSHTLSLLGDGIVLQSSLLNSGSGAINLIAGWNGTEIRPDHLTDTGVFGGNGANIYIQNGAADVSVGSAGGKTTVAANVFILRGENGFIAQLGYNGGSGGDILVKTAGGAAIQYDNGTALLGNGALSGSINDDITGNITLDIGGQLTLSTNSGANPIYLGNYATSGHTASGDLTVLTTFVYEDSPTIETNIAHALAGGDVTVGARANDLTVSGPISYSSSHTLSLLSIFGVQVNAAVNNGGSGDINIVAGWDTTTLTPAAFTNTGVYGGNGALLSLDAEVSSATGVLTLASHRITQSAAIAAGTLDAFATGTITLTNADNVVSAASFHAAEDASFTNDSDTELGASIVVGQLMVSSSGNITQSGALAAASLVASADTDITLEDADNAVDAASFVTTDGSVTLVNSVGVELFDTDVSGALTVTASTGDITLGDVAAGDGLSITATLGGIAIEGEVNAGCGCGAVTLMADGDITETVDGVILGGDLSVTSTSGGAFITGENTLTGTVTFDVATDVSFFNDASVTLGASTAGGSLGIQTYGGITVTGTVSAASVSLESLDTGDIDIQAALSADDDITLQTATGSITQTSDGTLTATTLFAYTIDGNLVLDGAANAISDTVSLFTQAGDASFTNAGDFTVQDTVVTGLLTLTATTGDITLADGDFFGVSANGLTVDAQDGGILITGEVESCGCGAVTLTASGDIIETGDGFILADELTATSWNGSIALANDWNDLSGTVSLTASKGDATVFNSGDFDFGTSVVGGTLRVETAGSITQSGAITAGTLELWSYDSGDITLEDAGNAVGAASFIADDGSVTFVNSAGFELFDTEVEGHLTVTADAGDIVLGDVYAQTGLDVTATLGGITLDGDVSTCGCGSVTLLASGDIVEGSGTLETGGDATITSTGGNIVFLNENHVLGTLRLVADGDAMFGNNDVTTLGASSAGGAMFIGTEGDLTQTGALTAVDLVVIALPYDNGFDIVGSNVTLDDTTNDISGRVAFMVSGDVTFVSDAAFTLGDVTMNGFSDPVANQIGGDLSARSVHGGITIDGKVATGLGLDGDDPVLTAEGDIIETGDGFITGGDLTATSTNGNIVLMNANNVLTGTVVLNAAGNASFATSDEVTLGATTTAGNFTVLSQGDIYIAGSIQNAGAGNITLIAGWDGTTTDAAHLLDDGVYGNGGDIEVGGPINIAVGSASGTTTLAATDIEITPTFGYHQIGYHGAGGGDIVVRALGDLELTAGASAGSHAHIGNGSLDADIFSNVTGNIDIRVAGLTTLHGVTGGPKPWIGNAAAPGFASGDIQLLTGDLDANVSLNAMLTSDIEGGNVTVGLTDAGAQSTIGAQVFYDSAHVLSILTAGSVEIGGSIQNDGAGAINIIAGWDGTTLDPTHFGDVGVSGNGNGSVTIGGTSASGDAAIGSALGTTSIAGRNVTLSAINGLAQAGYHGSGTGAVRINATGGTLALAGGNSPGIYAQLGGSSSFGLTSSDLRGDVTVVAGNMTATGLTAVTADALKLILTGNTGAIGSAISPIKFASNSLAVQTVGRNAFLASPNEGVLIGGTGIALSGGNLKLSAGGPITQTAAVLAGTFNVSTTAGAITLTNGGNGFGALTATTAGSNNASFTHSSQLTVASANVGGTLTLSAGTGINQSGAIHAAALTVSSQNGAIVLGNTGNSFATLTATTQNTDDASFTDSVAVTVASANVGGKLTVAAGGAIGQSGAIHAGSLAVSTGSGAITLTHAGNNYGALSVTTAGADNANLFNDAQLTVAGANVGGVLTLSSSAGIGQTGGIHAAGLSVTSANGAIVLTRNDNSFATLSVNTQNSDNASITDGSALSISGANVGGTLHLLTAGALSQSGAIHAASLDAATTSGAITLTDAGNLFGTLTVSTLGAANAALVNSGALSVTSANVGGLLTLATGGALTQTGAIHAGSLNVSTTAGAITLTDAGNVFGGLTAATTGSDDASFRHASQLTVAGANVGGTLVLNAGGGINQSGAIHAAALNATSANGAIVLGNAGNSFATLTATTQNTDDASFTDSVGVTVASANVGGKLTVAAGGAIGQSGAIHAAGLNVSTTSGAIVLTNAGNAFGALNVSTQGTDDASLVDSTALSVTGANVGGLLTLVTDGALTQTGAIHAGSLNVSTTAGAITLTHAGNAFGGLTVTTTGSNGASFTHAGQLSVVSANVGGTLTLHAGAGVNQSGAIQAAALDVSSSDGAIQLTHAGNSFASLTAATGDADNAAITDSIALVVSGADVGGTLTLAAGGAITQSGAIHAGALGVSATSGAITLTHAGNAFGSLTVATAGSAAANLVDSTQLTVAGANVGGTLTLHSDAGIDQTGAIHAAALDVSSSNGAILLGHGGNEFATLAVATQDADDATVADSGALQVVAADVGGTLTLTAGGPLTQSAAIHAAALNVSTTAGAITLTNAGNSFAALTAATQNADNATITDAGALSVTSADVGGTLTLTSGGALTQTGAIHAAALSINAAAGNISLTNGGNSFASLSVATDDTSDASITDSGALSVTTAHVGGKLTLVAGGALTQTGAIQAASLDVSTSTGAIVLTNAANAFGVLNVSTQGTDNASLVDSTALSIGGANVGGLLTLLTGGALTQTGAIHAGSLNLSTTAGAITLTHAGNAFGALTVATTGSNAASLFDSAQLTVADASVGGLLTLSSAAGVGQTGAIHAAGLVVSSSNGAIVLTNAGNSFATLSVTTQNADNATVADTTALSITGAQVGGTLTLASGGALTQTGAIHAAALDVSTATGAITLTNAGNSFAALTAATQNADSATITDAGALSVTSANVGGTLTLAAGGTLTQTGAIHAAGLNVSTTSGAIALTHGANSFATLTVATQNADNATITDATALSLTSANVGGLLTLAAGGALTQTGAIHSGALNVSTTTGGITLTNAGNDFGGVTVTTAASNNASLTNSALLNVVAANVGGTLTLTAAPGVEQSGAIVANALELTSAGAISLTNASNSFGTLTVTDSGTAAATVRTSGALVVAGANTGGLLALTAGGNITQTGTLTTHSLSATTSTGNIAFNNASNVVSGTVQLVAPGTVTLYNTSGYTTGTMTAGGDLTLLSRGSIVIPTAIQNAGNGAITVVAGWDGITTAAGSLTNAGVFGNNSGSVTITGATGNVAVGSKGGQTLVAAASITLTAGTTEAGGYAQLGYHGSGGGAIRVAATQGMTLAGNSAARFAMVGNGSLGSDVTGNQTGDIDVRLGGDLTLNGPTAALWFGNLAHSGTASGNVVLIANDIGGTGDAVTTSFVAADLVGGDVTLGFTGTGDQGPDQIVNYNSAHTLNLLAAGNVSFAAGVQNAGTGAINVVAGWDRITLTPASFGNAGVYGNNGKGVLIGTAQTTGDVPVGSFGGKTSVYGAALTLAAVNGFAQLGYHGHGNGAVFVKVTGGVTLSGGAGLGQFAQLGNGGFQTIGNNSGDIVIAAGGDIALNGGAGVSAYAQVGNGGGESNLNSTGYSNTGATTLTATNVLLTSGAGSGAYTMIGNGGLRIGFNLSGNAVNSGNISVVVSHDVTVTGGAGLDAFAQIGNGGSESNLNPTAASTGSSTGDIVIQAPSGPDGAVTLAAGAGGNAYSQIGNGGFAANYGPLAVAANFLMSGNITVTDLALSGGNTGSNAYALIGNGDATRATIGNVGGAIVIDVGTGTVSYTHGTAAHTPATIGNITGNGTNTGSLVGATPPSDLNEEPVIIGIIAGGTKPPPNNGITTIATVVVASNGNPGATNLGHRVGTPGPIASLEGDGTLSGADSATVVIADSLDGARKPVASQMLLGGILKQAAPYHPGGTVHGVPPADQDFSSWGNEALWQ